MPILPLLTELVYERMKMIFIVLGAGVYGRIIADVAEQTRTYENIKFLDDHVEGDEILGTIADFRDFVNPNIEFYPAIGNNKKRIEWIEELANAGAKLATIIHPAAYVSPQVKISIGVAILPGAIVNTDVKIGKGCIVNIGAIIDHGTWLEEGVHIAPGAIVKGQNIIKAFSKIESGTVVERGHLNDLY